MSDTKIINEYITSLSRHLSLLPAKERRSIVDEIRMHLEARAKAGRLTEAITNLGEAEVCAQTYLEELSVSQAQTDTENAPQTHNLLLRMWGRVSALLGFGLMGFLYLLVAAFVFSLGYELINPSQSGMWLQDDHLHWGITSGIKYDIEQEVLGFWFIPINIVLILMFFFLAEKVGRLSKNSVFKNW